MKFVDHRFLLDFEGCLHWDRDLETPDHRFFFFYQNFCCGGCGVVLFCIGTWISILTVHE